MTKDNADSLPRRRLTLAWVCAAALVLLWAAGAAAVCRDPACVAASLDGRIMSWLWARRSPGLDAAFGALTWLGSLAVVGPAAVLAAGLLLRARRAPEAAFLLVAVFGASAAAHLAKLAILRPRPALHEALVAMPADASFPSAHAAQVAALAGALVYLVARRGSAWQPAAALLAVLVVAVVGASRIYLQVHFPSDVAAGALGGLLWVTALAAAMPARRPA